MFFLMKIKIKNKMDLSLSHSPVTLALVELIT